MKKAFLLVSILFISVVSTACINNFAVQELNNNAKVFMEKGDYTSAIERLKSSIDLDNSIFETHYNLAVAYTNAEDYQNAIKAYNNAIALNPDFADVYYSLAVCQENLAKDIISGDVLFSDDGTFQKSDDDKKVKLSEASKNKIVSLLNDSVSNYELYLQKDDSSKDDVQEEIDEINQLLKEYTK